MLDSQKLAHAAYQTWCDNPRQAVDNAQVLTLAIGYIIDQTDGRPDENERELLALMRRAVRETTR